MGPLTAPARAGAAAAPALEFRGISKAFPGQLAVDDVSFAVAPGEVHALVGENGAGKTTLIKVLAGRYRPDGGEMLLDGRPLDVRHPWDAFRHGIAFVHQEPTLVPRLSIAENVTLGLPFERGAVGAISWRRHRARAAGALERVGLDADPAAPLLGLSVAERQLVAIARVLLIEPRVVVYDEVTAPLTRTEVDRLFGIIARLRDDGVAGVYISHRLEEVFRVAQRVTVLRNGKHVSTRSVAGLDRRELTSLIIGRAPERGEPDRPARPEGAPVLTARNLCDEVLRDVSFDLHAGEVLGLAGLAGAGRTNVLEAVFGARRLRSGSVSLSGRELTLRHPGDAIREGIALVTEDRKRSGYAPGFPVWKNITLPWVERYARGGVLRLGRERAAAAASARRFDVRAASVETPMRLLSGGNQQKAILARWLSEPLQVLLLDEPTHGVDIGAKGEIHQAIRRLAEEGLAVLVVSSELEELEAMCQRVLLLREGRIIGQLTGAAIDKGRMLDALFTDPDEE